MNHDTLIADVETLSEALAGDLEAEGARAIEASGRFSIAIPGGSVASAFFARLARLSFDWSRTEFFWVDERAVPPDNPESNYRLARSLWLEPARVPDSRIHRMPAEKADLALAAREYADEITRIAGHPPVLDFVLLGVGPDGHVASLFPRHPASANTRDIVVAVSDAPKPPPRRLTLALPVLTSARRVVIAAFGTAKTNVIRAVLAASAQSDESILPVAAVQRGARRVLLLLDEEAGGELRLMRR